MIIHVYRAADEFRLNEVVFSEALPEMKPAPATLASEQVCVLIPHGSLFFASAAVLDEKLPKPGDAQRPVVMLLLRGHDHFGSTFLGVITRYARALKANGGRLMLVGVSENVRFQLKRTRLLDTLGKDNVFVATSRIGEALFAASGAAQSWLQKRPD
jgi:SulP family sulfate permease